MAQKCRKSPKDDKMMMMMMTTTMMTLNQTAYNESSAEKAYVESNNSKKQLFFMCVGLTHGGRSVFDVDAEQWKTIRRRDIKPSRFAYAQEVSRRGALLDMQRIPKTANWRSSKCIRWLEAHPPKDEQDILFLNNEVQRLEATILEAQQERHEQEARQSGQWRGAIPYMRLITCLIQDNIKFSFLRRADARTRQELDHQLARILNYLVKSRILNVVVLDAGRPRRANSYFCIIDYFMLV